MKIAFQNTNFASQFTAVLESKKSSQPKSIESVPIPNPPVSAGNYRANLIPFLGKPFNIDRNPFSYLPFELSHPLPPEKLTEVIKTFQETKSLEVRNKIVESNLRLAARVANKFHDTSFAPEDLFQIATIGLIKAVESYKPEKGVALSSYAGRVMYNEILENLNHVHKEGHTKISKNMRIVNLGDEVMKKDGAESLEQYVSDPNSLSVEEKALKSVEISELKEAIKSLPERLSKVLECAIADGVPKTNKQIAREVGLCQHQVSRNLKAAKSILIKSQN